jgi:phage gpG-like protein
VADQIRVEVHGYPELAAGTSELAANITDASAPAFVAVADLAAGRVRGTVPRDTGRLAASVLGERTDRGALVTMGEGVAYAQFVEYGGRGHPHSPTGNYLYPIAMSAEPILVATGERVAQREIGAMHWPSP